MAKCKDCIHSNLCADMHRFGVVDLPYNPEGAVCEYFIQSPAVKTYNAAAADVLKELEKKTFTMHDDDSGEFILCMYCEDFEEIKQKYTEEQK